jgi:transcription elongation GreA/GreB family factor
MNTQKLEINPDVTHITSIGLSKIESQLDIETYLNIGSAATDPGAGLISKTSPLGRALLDFIIGDEVQVIRPGGFSKFRVVAVR